MSRTTHHEKTRQRLLAIRLFIYSAATMISWNIWTLPAKGADAVEIPCAETPFQNPAPDDKCRVARQVAVSYMSQAETVDIYLLSGHKDGVSRFHHLCAAKGRSYCKAVPVEVLKAWIEERMYINQKLTNWSKPATFPSGMVQDFDYNDTIACRGFVRYDQAADSGYRFWLIGTACTGKSRSDKDAALHRAVEEFTTFKR